MARWFDDYLLANERRSQVSHKANIARERKRKIDSGEMKFVPTYEAKPGQTIKSAEERNATRLKNARQREKGYGSTNSRKILKEAFRKKVQSK